jgi:hypothetical protein
LGEHLVADQFESFWTVRVACSADLPVASMTTIGKSSCRVTVYTSV